MNTAAERTGPKKLLHILPQEMPLHSGGPLLKPVVWSNPGQESEPDQPRALRALARIIDGGLCHRCGSCVGICPTGVLGLSTEAYPTVISSSSCTDCDLCVKVCPGDEFQYQSAHTETFGVPGDPHATHGHFIDSLVAYATDPHIREHSTSGGLVTAILLDMIERGEIDGCLTIQSNGEKLWKGEPVIARTREQILASMKSKYAISPTNAAFAEIRKLPGRYAIVGLPCQIHGFVKAAKLDERIRERVVLSIGLFCHAAIEHRAFEVIWESLGEKTKRARRFISRVGKHPGTPYLELDDGSLYPVYFGEKKGYRPTSIEMINILYRLYTPSRCLTCFDASAEFADIAVGDPWMAPPEDEVNFYQGWSFALVRTERAKAIVDRLKAEKKIGAVTVTRREALACNTMMSHEKRWRAFRVIETHRRQGKAIPRYDIPSPKHSVKHFVKTELHMLTHILCFLPSVRDQFLRFILGNGGYAALWLNEKRRAFRFWRRDTLALFRRRVWGRR